MEAGLEAGPEWGSGRGQIWGVARFGAWPGGEVGLRAGPECGGGASGVGGGVGGTILGRGRAGRRGRPEAENSSPRFHCGCGPTLSGEYGMVSCQSSAPCVSIPCILCTCPYPSPLSSRETNCSLNSWKVVWKVLWGQGQLNPRHCVVSITSVAQLVILRQIKPPGYLKLKGAGLTSVLLCALPSIFVCESLLLKRTILLSNVSNVQRKNTLLD